MKVAIVTPTIGSPVLKYCIESVQDQTYDDVVHYVFMDGKEHWKTIQSTFIKIDDHMHTTLSNIELYKPNSKIKVKTVALEDNVGKGWYGHRVYAACSFLVNADLICYLDEDNWLEPNHVESMVKTLKQSNADWVYSLRKIHDKQGEYICNDDCESLGKWKVFSEERNHIDTNCYMVKREVALQLGHSWYAQWGADRQFMNTVMKYAPKYECSGEYTVCYRLDGNQGSVQKQFFLTGNEIMRKKYNDKFPWGK